ncbi:hypothetical protein L2E82_16771 [Cichorium intybus]|uniref:Uncharacterized protein n=1 Tax=Cichorium intybus TaxID=13427 RepID=A0ACB9F6X7_CICIN|nr:hypothetical protein L2E82_16771 [Cichorium intybus]
MGSSRLKRRFHDISLAREKLSIFRFREKSRRIGLLLNANEQFMAKKKEIQEAYYVSLLVTPLYYSALALSAIRQLWISREGKIRDSWLVLINATIFKFCGVEERLFKTLYLKLMASIVVGSTLLTGKE